MQPADDEDELAPVIGERYRDVLRRICQHAAEPDEE
ncbi:hypothetical protein EDC50_1024 [Vulcaniibacterium tengchongense]|uniref:Uncharacterized protein n=1 Tax=Vulcaniibacterium tengchongense TaxID=1273429 RepID=A0A3N4VFN0_9GAMM|nr:hypothetical protein EDC50_1024 [Vulcaniibacterium tengchongense]